MLKFLFLCILFYIYKNRILNFFYIEWHGIIFQPFSNMWCWLNYAMTIILMVGCRQFILNMITYAASYFFCVRKEILFGSTYLLIASTKSKKWPSLKSFFRYDAQIVSNDCKSTHLVETFAIMLRMNDKLVTYVWCSNEIYDILLLIVFAVPFYLHVHTRGIVNKYQQIS